MVHLLKIRVRHDCPFLDLTKLFNGISYGYCIRDYDVLSLPGNLDEEILNVASQGFPNFEDWKISTIQEKVSYIQMSCLCESLYNISITGKIQNAGGLIKYPISYKQGWEYYSIMAFDQRISGNVLGELDAIDDEDTIIEVLSNVDVGIDGLFRSQMLSGPELFEDVTSRQLEILIKAIEMGYYEIPRNTRTKDIAKIEGKERYTIDKLLRTAENKIMKKLTPYLYFRQYLSFST